MKRIQRKRTKGWKMPENTIYVGRPTKFGNPLKLVGDMIYIDASWRRKTFDKWVFFQYGTNQDVLYWYDLLLNHVFLGQNEDLRYWNRKLIDLPLNELKGKDLACFCSLDCKCHADILLLRVLRLSDENNKLYAIYYNLNVNEMYLHANDKISCLPDSNHKLLFTIDELTAKILELTKKHPGTLWLYKEVKENNE